MNNNRTCPDCGAHLDPCEECDCMKNAAPVLAHKDGTEQIGRDHSTAILQEQDKERQEFAACLDKAGDVKTVMAEAILQCWNRHLERVFNFGPEVDREAALRLEQRSEELESEGNELARIYRMAANHIRTDWLKQEPEKIGKAIDCLEVAQREAAKCGGDE